MTLNPNYWKDDGRRSFAVFDDLLRKKDLTVLFYGMLALDEMEGRNSS